MGEGIEGGGGEARRRGARTVAREGGTKEEGGKELRQVGGGVERPHTGSGTSAANRFPC